MPGSMLLGFTSEMGIGVLSPLTSYHTTSPYFRGDQTDLSHKLFPQQLVAAGVPKMSLSVCGLLTWMCVAVHCLRISVGPTSLVGGVLESLAR